MAMNPDRRVIDDGQLDEALRRIASAPVPADLPDRVLDAIHADVDGGWLRVWRPAIGVGAFGVVLLVAAGVWMKAPDVPREAQGTGRTAQGPETAHLRTVAPSAPLAPPRAGHIEEHRMDPPPQRTFASAPLRPPAPYAPREAQSDEIELLEPPEPLTVVRLQMTELSERALQVDALHIPALEMETLER